MAISEKELEEIKNDFDKTNKKICELYKKSGNEEILEMLYLGTHDPKSVAARSIAESFGLPLEMCTCTGANGSFSFAQKYTQNDPILKI